MKRGQQTPGIKNEEVDMLILSSHNRILFGKNFRCTTSGTRGVPSRAQLPIKKG